MVALSKFSDHAEMNNCLVWTINALCFYNVLLSTTSHGSIAANIPCAARDGDEDQGKICVCNATYCDTIERPAKLRKGHYHLYTTSNSTPGFSATRGRFRTDNEPPGNDLITFIVNTTIRFQEIIGFGGSFTDSVGVLFNTLPEAAQDNLINSYFGPSGIEYTLGRVPIGGSGFSDRFYTLDDVPDDEDLQSFNLTQEDYIYKIPVIKRALSASTRGIKFYGCAFWVPDWMKDGIAGYIPREHLSTWAKYHVKFIQAYKEAGINIWAISEGNERMMGFLSDSMMGLKNLMPATDQRLWLKEHLIPQLQASNLSDVKFLGLDDVRLFASYYIDRFADDQEAYDLLGGVALHWYYDFITPPTILDYVRSKMPDKLLLYTETSVSNVLFWGKPVELGSWFRASAYIYNIIDNINHGVNGYIDWNLALNPSGGPGLFMPLDPAIVVNTTSGEFYKQPAYYGIGHFSKFMPPGSRRIQVFRFQSDITSPDDDAIEEYARLRKELFSEFNPTSDSFYAGKKAHLPPPIDVPSVVKCLATANPDKSFTIIVFNSKNEPVRVRIEDPMVGSVTLDIEQNSINTFYYWH